MFPLLRVYVVNGQEFVVGYGEVGLHIREPWIDSNENSHLMMQDLLLLPLNIISSSLLPQERRIRPQPLLPLIITSEDYLMRFQLF